MCKQGVCAKFEAGISRVTKALLDPEQQFAVGGVFPHHVNDGTNVRMSVGHPYGNIMWRKPMSTGQRVALEVRRAVEIGQLDQIVT